jgi:hypothetical protein
MTNPCKDPKSKIFVELEPAAVWALLNDSYRALKNWEQWELRHHALAPLRLISRSGADMASDGRRVYRIEMRCEQGEALRDRSEELAEILEDMPDEMDRDAGSAVKRATRAFDEAIRLPLPE